MWTSALFGAKNFRFFLIYGAHLRDIAPRQHSYLNVEAVANRLQRCVRLVGPGFEIQTSRT